MVNIERKQLARILGALVKQNANIGEYLELEQVFIKKTEVDVGLDRLLKVFEEFERTGEGKKE
jgi:hypothetical protein